MAKVTIVSRARIEECEGPKGFTWAAIMAAHEIVDRWDNYFSRFFFLQADEVIPAQFLSAFLRREFARELAAGKAAVVVGYRWWNGSYHAAQTDAMAPGEAVLALRGRRSKNIFSRLRRASREAARAWKASVYEAHRGLLVARGMWAREGD